MEENNNLEQKEEKETVSAEENTSNEVKETEDTAASFAVEDASSETNNDVADSAITQNEEEIKTSSENEDIDDESIIKEKLREAVEEALIEKDKVEEVSDSKETEADLNTSDETAPIICEEENNNDIKEIEDIISPSSKPQAVLDELDKLKSVSHNSDDVEKQNEATDSSSDNEVNKSEDDSAVKPNQDNNSSEIETDNHGFVVANYEITKSEEVIMENSESNDSTVDQPSINEVANESTEEKSVEEKSVEEKSKEESSSEEKASPANSDESSSTKLKHYFNADFWKSFFFDIIFLGFCIFFTLVLVQKWFFSQEAKIIGTNQIHASLESGEKTTIGNINILVMGIDSVEGTHRSDTIFVLGVNPSKGKITMLSIPRDTRVITENKARKINEVLPRYGEPTLRKILEDLLKINISRKIEVGFESFIEVVDAIGGVDINIEKPMHYDDNWGNLHIHFNPGMNHLNGQDALRYVRFRKDAMADLGRIKRQQEFVKAIVKKIMSPSSIVKLPNIIEKAFKHIKTDFTLQEVLTLAKGFNTTDVKFRTLSIPGDAKYIDKISYFIPSSEESIAIGNNYFSDLAIFELEKNYEADKIMPIQSQSKSSRKNK